MDEIATHAMEIGVNIGVALLGLAGAYAMLYIRKATRKIALEAEKLEDEKQEKLIKEALDRLDDIAEKTVTTIEQTVAKNLREAVKNGEANKQQLKKLSGVAYNEIISTLKPEYIEALTLSLGDVESYIEKTIETKLYKLKKQGIGKE